jgi:hypothetical protein
MPSLPAPDLVGRASHGLTALAVLLQLSLGACSGENPPRNAADGGAGEAALPGSGGTTAPPTAGAGGAVHENGGGYAGASGSGSGGVTHEGGAAGSYPELGPPSVRVLSPSAGAEITDSAFSVSVEIENYVLRDPGACGKKRNCGVLRVQLDADNCNTGTAPFNALITVATGTPTESSASGVVNTSACRASIIGGSAQLRVELLNGDYEPLEPVVADEVKLEF